ncbi:chymotrypsin-2-like [Lycorma delicatula]|uniref:chymotrypsin-2-like n=1 Tax=Lycorma delicatula TaxID=130591 RepID=UPI003F516459
MNELNYGYTMYLITVILVTFFLKDATSYTNRLNSAGKLNSLPDELNQHYITGVYGGKNVTIDKAKYIGFMFSEGDSVGAVVILNKNWLLTVAFNLFGFQDDQTYFIVGRNNLKESGIKVYPKNFFTHPNYTGSWDYDIALIKLKESLKFSRKIKSISISSKLPSVGSETIFSGYGYTNGTSGGYLQQARVPYLDYKGCLPHYNSSSNAHFTKYSFCTLKDGVGPCLNDWGGPLVYKNKLIGIFAGSYGCASTTYPPVYTDVTQFKNWISKTIKDNSDFNEEIDLSQLV